MSRSLNQLLSELGADDAKGILIARLKVTAEMRRTLQQLPPEHQARRWSAMAEDADEARAIDKTEYDTLKAAGAQVDE